MNATDLDALFAYGTLEIPEVFAALAGRAMASEAATLDGYRRSALRERRYPGVAPDPATRVEGSLIPGIGAPLWRLLDVFEGDEYERVRVEVRVGEGVRPAFAYVVRPERVAELTGEAWSCDRFRSEHLVAYLRACERFRAGFESSPR